jgi:predicted Zn-dependent protease
LGGIAANLLLLRNSREAELESDEYGMRYAAKQGYDAAGMIRVQQTLLEAGGGANNPVAEMLATHPSSQNRIEQARILLPSSTGGRREEAAYRKATAGLRP